MAIEVLHSRSIHPGPKDENLYPSGKPDERSDTLMKLSLSRIASAGLFCLLAGATAAHADTFTIQYFEAPTGQGNFYNGNPPGIGTSLNYVMPTLGPDGLPVFNPSFTGSGVFAPVTGYTNSAGELLYWTAGKNGIIADGTSTINLSSTAVNMFAPGTGGNDLTYEETAIISGNFTVLPGDTDTITFTIGADDMAFAYVFPAGAPNTPNSLVESLGGIHGDTGVPSNTVTYGPGTYTIEIFYADLDTTQAALSFTDSGNLTITPTAATPEPGTLVLLGTGLVGAAGAIRRRIAR